MSRRRPPSPPPQITGFTLRELLGSGGFADVFLYDQHMPSRAVAVKVMLKDVRGAGAQQSFDAEANIMAKVSNHPSIVTIYHADITTDGRPYLVMEYCPKPNLGVRYKREQIGVAEALRIGIQVCGAVETAHRAGIIHRDIKPANILVTEYNRPALTDFGISVTIHDSHEDGPEGMSIPWAPPEVVGDHGEIGVAADVYSLAATVYTLLAGRSPFEVPGGTNNGAALISRIENSALPSLGRGDVPGSLERVLATAMAKDPARRYHSALSFALALQQIQSELQHAVTAIDVLDDSEDLISEEDDEGGSTAVRSIVSIDPHGAPGRAGVDGSTGGYDFPSLSNSGWFNNSRPSIHTGPTSPLEQDWDSDFFTGPTTPGQTSRPPGVLGPDGRMIITPAGVADVPTPLAGENLANATLPPMEVPVVDGAPETTDEWQQVPVGLDDTVRPARRPQTPVVPHLQHGKNLDHSVFGADDDFSFPSDTELAHHKKRRRNSLIAAIIGGSALAVVSIVGFIALNGAGDSPKPPDWVQPTQLPPDHAAFVPRLTSLAAREVPGGIEFSWTNPQQEKGDSYTWTFVGPAIEEKAEDTTESQIVVNPDPSGRTCIQVTLNRGEGSDLKGQSSAPAEVCYPN